MLRDEAAVLDILRAARLARAFLGSLKKDDLLRDAKTQSSILHQLLVVGEAVKRLSPDFRAEHSRIGWKRIAGTRDVIIHQYDRIDIDEVWHTLTVDLPELIAYLEPLAPSEPDSEPKS